MAHSKNSHSRARLHFRQGVLRNGVLLCALIFSAGRVCAAPPGNAHTVAIHGFDKMSCLDWDATRDDLSFDQLYIAWIRGVVTGYNFGNPDDQVALGKMPGDRALALYLDRYCRAHPSNGLADAAFALIEEIHGRIDAISGAPGERSVAPLSFEQWLMRQSDDMQSLDPDMLQKIYKKESALEKK